MPQFNNNPNWHGLEIEVHPLERWRQRFRFWPYFVGQKIQLELKIRNSSGGKLNDVKFYVVERMAGADKPKILTPNVSTAESFSKESVFQVKNSSRVTAKGEVKYWVSNQGYNVDSDPIFTAEVINLDSVIIQLLMTTIGPILGFIAGLLIGLLN